MKHVVDTHPLIWFLTGNAQLGANALTVLSNPNSELVLPAIALAEACWIVERGRTPIPSVAALLSSIDSNLHLTVAPLDRPIVERSMGLSNVGEMHDRQIVATALVLVDQGESVSLLTRDANIIASGLVPTVW
jgi:PIN domain nuclease of toxin-antitoxin system